jgi:hypothetical protein
LDGFYKTMLVFTKKPKSPVKLQAYCLLMIAMACPLRAAAVEPQPWPASNLATFVFEHLDLTTFRNSTGPRRAPGQRHFSDLGIKPTRASETEAVSESSDWSYSIKVLGRRDFNGDGMQEVAICFSDVAGKGTYNVQEPLLVQMLEGRAVAIAFDISGNSDVAQCRKSH